MPFSRRGALVSATAALSLAAAAPLAIAAQEAVADPAVTSTAPAAGTVPRARRLHPPQSAAVARRRARLDRCPTHRRSRDDRLSQPVVVSAARAMCPTIISR
jgi:hypothetical protein